MAHTTNIVLRRVLWCTCVAQQCANVGSAGKLQFWSIVGENAVVLPFIVAAPVLGAISCQLKRRKQAASSMKAVKRIFEKPYAWSQWSSFAPFSFAKKMSGCFVIVKARLITAGRSSIWRRHGKY